MNKNANNTGKILRALRKYYALSQIDFAKHIDVNQSTLSRIEKGRLELTALQWVNLVEKYHLDARCLTSGKIELLELRKINLRKEDQVGGFKKLPLKYNVLRGSTVRCAYPLLQYMENHLGEEKKNEFLKSLKLDPDYFTIQNLPLNIMVIHDIFKELEARRLLTKKNYLNIFNDVSISDTHSYFIQSLKATTKYDVAFKKLTNFVANHYEINTDYEFVGDKSCYIRAKSQRFLNKFNFDENFEVFRSLYNLSHFNKLAPIFSSDHNFELKTNKEGWDIAIA